MKLLSVSLLSGSLLSGSLLSGSLLSLLFSAPLAGCAKRSDAAAVESYDRSYDGDYAPAPPPPPPMEAADDWGGAPARGMSARASGGMPSGGVAKMDTAPATAPAPRPARMVHYDGYAKVRVSDPAKTLEEVAEKARSVGGRVEQQVGQRVVIRVPVESFQATYDHLLTLGDVLDKSLSAEDVTESFTAVDLRLKTATATRDRLMVLLSEARNEREKLEILQQIQRVSEQIDVLNAQINLLKSLAAWSRITLEAEARQAMTRVAESDIDGFNWISQLSPFERNVAAEEKLLKLPVPVGMVALDDKKHLVAESADGAVFWTSRRPNDPVGTTAFWLSAVEERLAEGFGGAEPVSFGEYKGIRFLDPYENGYRYVVALKVEGKWLDVVEIYYPGEAQEKRYGDAVRTVLAGGEG